MAILIVIAMVVLDVNWIVVRIVVWNVDPDGIFGC